MSQKYSQMILVDTQTSLPASADIGQLAYCQDTGLSLSWNGSAWTPTSKVQVKKSTIAVNLKSTGQTALYTLEASSLNFYPTQIVMRATGAGVSGVTIGPTVSIGTNATSYNNIASTTLLANVISLLTGGSTTPTTVSNSPALAGGTQIFCNVSVGATATNYTVFFDIIGFYDT